MIKGNVKSVVKCIAWEDKPSDQAKPLIFNIC